MGYGCSQSIRCFPLMSNALNPSTCRTRRWNVCVSVKTRCENQILHGNHGTCTANAREVENRGQVSCPTRHLALTDPLKPTTPPSAPPPIFLNMSAICIPDRHRVFHRFAQPAILLMARCPCQCVRVHAYVTGKRWILTVYALHSLFCFRPLLPGSLGPKSSRNYRLDPSIEWQGRVCGNVDGCAAHVRSVSPFESPLPRPSEPSHFRKLESRREFWRGGPELENINIVS